MSGRPGDHDAKRDALVDGAVSVLRRKGFRACTARSVAAAAGMSTSTIHYYFGHVDQVVEAAFRRIGDEFIDRLDTIAHQHADPVAALWAVSRAYLRIGSDRRPTRRRHEAVPMLWFDYQLHSARRGDTATVRELSARATQLFHRLVIDAGLPDPQARAEVLVSALLGLVARSTTDAPGAGDAERYLAAALGIPRPA